MTYTLGYYPEDREESGRFHTISVRVNRPGVALRYRSGYYRPVPQPVDPLARREELDQAAASPLDATGLGIQAKLAPIAGHPDQVECLLHIAPENIDFQPRGDRWAATLEILLLNRDGDEHPFRGREDRMALQLTDENYRKVMRTGINYRQILELQFGGTEIRVVVRDGVSGAIGSVTALLKGAVILK